mmetsp:Transcript_8189/g.26159  ORF Transcript_8189/g.26159 Transcript_8189/m.26159 type:complete len:98 (+) Transcript_8189:102-395(+)
MSWLWSSNPGEKSAADFDSALMKLQQEDSIAMYNSLVEKCFGTCVVNFRTGKLDSSEELCTYRCVEKFLRHSQRVSRIFAEKSAELAEGAKAAQPSE